MNVRFGLRAAMVAAVIITSCEDMSIQDECERIEITSVTAVSEDSDIDTKTVIDGETLDITWSSGNDINVFFGNTESGRFVTENSGKVAQFKGSISVVTGGGDDLTDDTSLWGIYPYDSSNTCDGATVTLNVPAIQEAKAGSFADDLFPQIARSKNFYMSFYNLCGSFRFKVTNPDIVKVTLTGNNGEELAGRARVSMVDVPLVQEVISGYEKLIMKAPDGECFEPGEYYYFVLYPGTFEKGLTLTFHKKDSQAEYVVSKSVTLSRGMFSSFQNRDAGLTFDEKISPDIVFEDDAVKDALVAAFDRDGDEEISYAEAEEVVSFAEVKIPDTITSFNEFQYFTGVTKVPASMFWGCSSLKSITFPESVVEIGEYAFYNCRSLISIELPESLVLLGDHAFDSSGLIQVALPENLRIGNSCFNQCKALAEVRMPESLASIGEGAFMGCGALMEMTIPESITCIEGNTFRGCASLTNINLPKSLTRMGQYAFAECGFSEIVLPSSLQILEFRAFERCFNLLTIVLPDSVTELGVGIFDYCTSLSSVKLPKNLKKIPDVMFMDCTSLTDINIPESVTHIGHGAFFRCASLVNVVIPESVRSMEGEAFRYCENLSRISIPSSVTSIPRSAFENCSNLTEVVLPENISEIGDYAFSGCKNIVDINIPNDLTAIGQFSFYNCNRIKELVITSPLKQIGQYAFQNCISLERITLPSEIVSISRGAFGECETLSEINIKAVIPPAISDDMLYGCTSLQRIYVPADAVNAYKENPMWASYKEYVTGALE